MAHGRPAAAYAYARAALGVKHRMHDGMGIAMTTDMLAQAAVAAHPEARGAHLTGLAQQVWDALGRSQLGAPQFVAARRACEQWARDALGDHAYEEAFHTGYTEDLDTGVAHVLRASATTGPPSPRDPIGRIG